MANTRVYWLHTLSPTHIGTGRGIGYIDLPLHREKVTNWPMIPGSSFKGVWRDWAEQKKLAHNKAAFGTASDNASESNAGALVPTDARLVCLPVRSLYGTFAWVTSPLALQMLRRDLSFAGIFGVPDVPAPPSEATIALPAGSKLANDGRVFLEDLDFKAKQDTATTNGWAQYLAGHIFGGEESWKSIFVERFAIVPDDVFTFLSETGTQVDARVHIDDDTKTVKAGQLWNEESLPAESILSGLVSCDRVFGKGTDAPPPKQVELLDAFAKAPLSLQIGGKATVGRGRVRCVFSGDGQ